MTYEEAIQFWYQRIDYERRQPHLGDLKLDRMRLLLHLLGNPHLRLRCIHIAGTKGKGSSAAMLASVLQHAGYRVGLFTSPHLEDIRERIQVDGELISQDELRTRMVTLRDAVLQMDTFGSEFSPTFFEVITALGMLHFLYRQVDLVVLEVGLGGRFDSTNVCRSIVSVITSISYDHTNILGNTLAEIAYQKAGIIRPRVPVVALANDPESSQVIESIALAEKAPLSMLGRDFLVFVNRCEIPLPEGHVQKIETTFDYSSAGYSLTNIHLSLSGTHQVMNAAGVIRTVECLRARGLTISDQALRQGLANTHWPARIEQLNDQPVVIVDSAHNVASVRYLIETLTTKYLRSSEGSHRILIFAASTDKDLAGMAQVLVTFFDTIHLCAYQSNPRSASPRDLAAIFTLAGATNVEIHDNPLIAWQAARHLANEKDFICITGSVFLAGELRSIVLKGAGARDH